MKQYISSLFFVIIFLGGLSFDRHSRIPIENPGIIDGYAVSELLFFSVDYSGITNVAVNTDPNQSLIQHLLSFSHKKPIGTRSIEKSVELTNNTKTSVNLYISKCHLIRFDGPDIIHPFNYFW